MKRKVAATEHGTDTPKAELHVRQSVHGCSSLTRSYCAYPIKFIQHGRNDDPACLVYVLGFGGGVVSSDVACMRWILYKHSTLYVKTQGVTKIYKNKFNEKSIVKLHAKIEDGAMLFNIPEHTSLFKDAHLQMEQYYDILGGGSLVAVDWFSSGRTESDTNFEVWNLQRLYNRVSISLDGKTVYSEELDLYSSDAIGTVLKKVGGATIFGSIILAGPKTLAMREEADEVNRRQSFEERKRDIISSRGVSENSTTGSTFFSEKALVSVSTLTDNLSIIRFAAGRIEDAYYLVNGILKFHPQSMDKYYIGPKHKNVQ